MFIRLVLPVTLAFESRSVIYVEYIERIDRISYEAAFIKDTDVAHATWQSGTLAKSTVKGRTD